MQQLHVTTVIPTYNGLRLLEKYLPSVIAASSDKDEILIVDDNSSDNTISTLVEKYALQEANSALMLQTPKGYFPDLSALELQIFYGTHKTANKIVRIVLIHLKKNLRFAAAANVGVLLSSNSLIFLLNNDVQVSTDTVQKLRTHFPDESLFAVGCLEYEGDDTEQKSGKNELWFQRGLFQHSRASNFTFGETAWASGGSAMFDKEKWMKLNGFDKAYYPAYWEDVDISYRAKKRGWKVLFDPRAIVFHRHESTNNAVFGRKHIEAMSWKNIHTFTWKNSTVKQKLQYLLWKPYWNWKKQG